MHEPKAQPQPHGFRAFATREWDITYRILEDNLLASFTPGLVLVTGVCIREKRPPWQIATLLAKSAILCILYTYIFDVSNQARPTSASEDKINKPYRPVPAGLLTPRGAICRFWIVMGVYTMTGWLLGVLEWVILWQVSTIIIYIWCPPRHYFCCKTFCMSLGVGSQLFQAWQLVIPIEETGRRWILFMAIAYPPPLIFEDVRDMPGDKAIGRRTLALILGETCVRIWFASIMTAMPILVNKFLLAGAVPRRVALCNILVATICWTTVAQVSCCET